MSCLDETSLRSISLFAAAIRPDLDSREAPKLVQELPAQSDLFFLVPVERSSHIEIGTRLC